MRSRRPSCRSASSATSFGIFAFLIFVAILLDLFLQFVAFAEFLLDRLHLLPQIKLALALVHFTARLRVDVVLDFENFGFFRHQFVNAA